MGAPPVAGIAAFMARAVPVGTIIDAGTPPASALRVLAAGFRNERMMRGEE